MSPPSRPHHADPVVAPGLAFPRLLSDADGNPLDAVPWTHRDLRGLRGAAELKGKLEDIVVPVDWTGQAAVAFLRSRVDAAAADGRSSTRLDVRQELEDIGQRLRDQGLSAGYFVRPEDAAVFADEITSLLLSQRAAFAPAASGSASHFPSSSAVQLRRLTPQTPGLADLLTSQGAHRSGNPHYELALATTFLNGADNNPDAGRLARSALQLAAECIRDGGDLIIRYTDDDSPGLPSHSQTPRPEPPSATLNLVRFLAPDGTFELALFCHVVQLLTTALEISVRRAQPAGDAADERPSRRPLCLSFAGLGALLMESGLPYAAELSQAIAAAIAAVLCGEALAHSARIAETCAPLDGSSDPHERSARSVARGACDAFRHDPAAALGALRHTRAAALQIVDGTGAHDQAQALLADAHAMRARASSPPSAFFLSQRLAQQLPELVAAARSAWDRALTGAELFGLRNLDVTALIADRRTADMLESDTVGLSPEDTLLRPERRTAAGRPAARRARRVVDAALFRLGYDHAASGEILASLERTGDLSHATRLRPEHHIVFACADRRQSPPARRSILLERADAEPLLLAGQHDESAATAADRVVGPAAILRMSAAVAPFLTTSAPLTLELPPQASAQLIAELLRQGSRLGLHSLHLRSPDEPFAGHRRDRGPDRNHDRSPGLGPVRIKPRTSPRAALSFPAADVPAAADHAGQRTSRLLRDHTALLDMQLSRATDTLAQKAMSSRRRIPPLSPLPDAARTPLPAERASLTHAFSIAGHTGSITVGLYPNGLPGEIAIRMTTGSAALTGLLDALSTATSLALQHGVPLRSFAEHVTPTRFDPSGDTANPQIPHVRSIVDYLFRWLELRFVSPAHLLPGE